MMLPFDEFAVTALLLVVVITGMRLFYGAWPWEARKTWYRTRQAVDYVEALRGEKKRDPALQRVGDVVDTSSDSFDRGLMVDDNSLPEVTPSEAPALAEEVAVSLQKATEKPPIVRRQWMKSSRRKQPIKPAETALLKTDDSDGGD
jgi:hypothetical protein